MGTSAQLLAVLHMPVCAVSLGQSGCNKTITQGDDRSSKDWIPLNLLAHYNVSVLQKPFDHHNTALKEYAKPLVNTVGTTDTYIIIKSMQHRISSNQVMLISI